MIVNRRTGFAIKSPKETKNLIGLDPLEWIFFVPDSIKNDQDKVIYKVGFLFDIYKAMPTKLKNVEIYNIISDKWQVFKSVRQLERLYAKYKQLMVKEEEN